MLRVLCPIVWLLNYCADWIVRPFVREHDGSVEKLSPRSRTLLDEGAQLPMQRQDMLLSILDLEKVTVNDIMVQRSDVNGLDLDDDIDEIVARSTRPIARLPVYQGSINNVLGILRLRNAFLRNDELTKAALMQETREPYFVPSTPLHVQLLNFQKEERRIGLVVDEYGDVQGISSLEDILEEIVGEFTSDMAARIPEIRPQDDGTHIIDFGTALPRTSIARCNGNCPRRAPAP